MGTIISDAAYKYDRTEDVHMFYLSKKNQTKRQICNPEKDESAYF